MVRKFKVVSKEDMPRAELPVEEDDDTVTHRHVCLGEALQAVDAYSDLDFAAPPSASILALLDVAYGHMTSFRPELGPEDFAVYAFSLLRECCADAGEEDRLKLAAARYILDKSAALSPDFAAFIPQARALVARLDAPRGVVPAPETRALPQTQPPHGLPAPAASAQRVGALAEDLRAVRGRAEVINAALERKAAKRAAIGTFSVVSAFVLTWLTFAAFGPDGW